MATQRERILKYMQDFGSINPQQAMADLGVFRLAARISDLKRDGHKIRRRMATGRNRYDQKVTYAEYYITEE